MGVREVQVSKTRCDHSEQSENKTENKTVCQTLSGCDRQGQGHHKKNISPFNSMADKQKTSSSGTHKPNQGKGNTSENTSSKGQPGISDVLAAINKLQLQVSDIDKRLQTLDILEKKVDNVDREIKSLWTYIHDNEKQTQEKIHNMEDNLDAITLSAGLSADGLQQIQRENSELKEKITYLQSQSMRNNLIFGNITESVNERPDQTESKFRAFMKNKLEIANDIVDQMNLERVHRMGSTVGDGADRDSRPRRIVCKFNRFQDRELVRKLSSKLKGSNQYISEQFPSEINKIRKELFPKLREARRQNKTAWISYDTLYIDGKPVKVD